MFKYYEAVEYNILYPVVSKYSKNLEKSLSTRPKIFQPSSDTALKTNYSGNQCIGKGTLVEITVYVCWGLMNKTSRYLGHLSTGPI